MRKNIGVPAGLWNGCFQIHIDSKGFALLTPGLLMLSISVPRTLAVSWEHPVIPIVASVCSSRPGDVFDTIKRIVFDR